MKLHEFLSRRKRLNCQLLLFLLLFCAFCRFYHDLVYDRALACLEEALDKWSALWFASSLLRPGSPRFFQSSSKNFEPPIEVSLYFHCVCAEIQESIGKDDDALKLFRVFLMLVIMFLFLSFFYTF
jgi:hypothetical protein